MNRFNRDFGQEETENFIYKFRKIITSILHGVIILIVWQPIGNFGCREQWENNQFRVIQDAIHYAGDLHGASLVVNFLHYSYFLLHDNCWNF